MYDKSEGDHRPKETFPPPYTYMNIKEPTSSHLDTPKYDDVFEQPGLRDAAQHVRQDRGRSSPQRDVPPPYTYMNITSKP
jgi:hypothetical protein